jgi:ferritin-like metal-binding protein YciE
MADDRNRDEIQQYVGDMAALESHIEEAIDGQLKHSIDHAEAAAAIKRFHTMVRGHRDSLKTHLESIGGSASHPVKSAVASLFGMAAGAVDNVRTKAVSKMLRDDYTAFNHAAMGYSMLHVTAHALGDMKTMDLADRYLRDYAKAAQEINQVIASVVIWELEKEGFSVNHDAETHCTEAINRAWRESAPSSTSSMRKAA